MNHYERLGIDRDADFKTIKKAYFRKAKECHPDLFANSRSKTEQFKLLVHAFDVLSDPEKRHDYNRTLGGPIDDQSTVEMPANMPGEYSIMDTAVDDTLEELVVGNLPPVGTTLATLFLDLERTEVFITFREGKDMFYRKRYRAARKLFHRCVVLSPGNILYQCFLARSYALIGDLGNAKHHYRQAIRLGERRVPPQQLVRVHKELDAVKRKQLPWWHQITSLFTLERKEICHNIDEQMIAETNRAIANLAREDARRKKKRKQLPK